MLAGKQSAETVYQIRQFPDIAGPVVGLEGVKKILGKCHGLFARTCKMSRKKLEQLGHVFSSLTQWRCVQRQHVQAVIQVFPEAAGLDLSLQVPVRGRNHPHMDLHRSQAAYRVNGSLLQDSQQLDLHVQRQVADLV